MGFMTLVSFTGRTVRDACITRPTLARLAELVSGVPETVYVIHNGVRVHLIVNGDGHTLGLPANAFATEIYWAYTRSKGGKISDYSIVGDAGLLEGAACSESESIC